MAKRKTYSNKQSAFFRSSTSYNKLAAAVSRGEISSKELRRIYTLQYASSQARVKAIGKSDIPFTREEALPAFHSVKTLASDTDILKALVDINRWFSGRSSTVTGRRAIRKETIETVNREIFKDQPVLNKENYSDWIDFWSWFRETGKDKLYASGASAVQEAAKAVVSGMLPESEAAKSLFREFALNH